MQLLLARHYPFPTIINTSLLLILAGAEDFVGDFQDITFESNSFDNLQAFIRIVDDRINEPLQIFVAYLEVIDAINPALVDTAIRNVSICFIFDNDGKDSNA